MTPIEFKRLKLFHRAKKYSPFTSSIGRRHAKGRAMGVGQKLVNGAREINSVSLEKVFYTKAR